MFCKVEEKDEDEISRQRSERQAWYTNYVGTRFIHRVSDEFRSVSRKIRQTSERVSMMLTHAALPKSQKVDISHFSSRNPGFNYSSDGDLINSQQAQASSGGRSTVPSAILDIALPGYVDPKKLTKKAKRDRRRYHIPFGTRLAIFTLVCILVTGVIVGLAVQMPSDTTTAILETGAPTALSINTFRPSISPITFSPSSQPTGAIQKPSPPTKPPTDSPKHFQQRNFSDH